MLTLAAAAPTGFAGVARARQAIQHNGGRSSDARALGVYAGKVPGLAHSTVGPVPLIMPGHTLCNRANDPAADIGFAARRPAWGNAYQDGH
jgi:hypothetical protein